KRNVQRVARACEGAISVFLGVKVCFEEKQTAFAASFYHIAQVTQACSYPQGWDLFFLSFFILSLFYKL
ncbi:hypothetical protein RNP85_25995, partial [Escherichia coli]|nr:hypothetical protein [Escherichia coli]